MAADDHVARLQAAVQEETAKRRGAEAALREAYAALEKQRTASLRQQQATEAEVGALRRAAEEGDEAKRILTARQLNMEKAMADADHAVDSQEGMRREVSLGSVQFSSCLSNPSTNPLE